MLLEKEASDGGVKHQCKLVNTVKEKKGDLFCNCKRSTEYIVNSSRFQEATSRSDFAPLVSTNHMFIFYLILVTVL